MKFILILFAGALLTHGAQGGNQPVRQFTLDAEKPIEIPVGTRTATTLQFPRPVQGIFGYGLTEGNAPGAYHYAHPSGSRLLSLRNLLPGKETFVTVLLGEEDLFVLHLKPSAEAPIAVRLRDPVDENALLKARPIDAEDAKVRKLDQGTARLFNLLKLGKNERAFRLAVPHLYKDAESRKVEYRYDDGKVATVVTKLHRFPKEDAVFLSARIENSMEEAQQFDPASLQVKVGSRTYPAALIDSAAVVPANGDIPLHVIIRGGVEGERAHLSIKNEFRLIMPAYGPCMDDPSLTDALGYTLHPPNSVPSPALFPDPGPSAGLLADDGPSDALFPEPYSEEGGSK